MLRPFARGCIVSTNDDDVKNDSFFSFCFSFLNAIREAEFKSKAEMANHLLLFVSALVPKALASLMTSFCIELAKPENVSKIIVYTMKILSSDAFYPSFPLLLSFSFLYVQPSVTRRYRLELTCWRSLTTQVFVLNCPK